MDLIKSLYYKRSFGKFRKRSNFAVLLRFASFLTNGPITFLYFFCIQLLGDDINQLSRDGFKVERSGLVNFPIIIDSIQ